MSAIEWVAVSVIGVIAYIGVLGVLWRVLRIQSIQPEVLFCYILLPVAGWVAVVARDNGFDHNDRLAMAAIWWPLSIPVAIVALIAYHAGRGLLLPLRATFRLAAGQTKP